MGVNSLPKTVARQLRGCDLNPGLSPPESSTLTPRLPSPPPLRVISTINLLHLSLVKCCTLLFPKRELMKRHAECILLKTCAY